MKLFKLKSNATDSNGERYIQPDLVRVSRIEEQEKSQFNRENHLLIFEFIDGTEVWYRSTYKHEVLLVLNDYLDHIDEHSQTKR